MCCLRQHLIGETLIEGISTIFMLALWAFCPALSSALGSKYTGLSKDSVSGSFTLLEDPATALRQHRIPLRKGWEYVNTHNTEFLSMELLRKDQLYFVDKHKDDGASELYSISSFSTRTTDNIRKGYLLGKYGAIPDIKIERLRD
mgnify:FL=1